MTMRSILFIALLFASAAAAADDPAAVVERFFRTYAAGGDLQAFWSEKAEGRPEFERAARLLHRVRCVELHGMHVDDRRIGGDIATARVTLLLLKRERETGRTWGPAPAVYDVKLSRTNGEWRIAAVTPEAQRMADALIGGAALAPEMLSADVNRVLIARAIDASNLPDLAKAARITAIAGDIAAHVADAGGESLHQAMRANIARMEGRAAEARVIARQALELARVDGDADVLARALITLARTYDHEPDSTIRTALFREAAALEDRVENLALMARASVGLEGEGWRDHDYVALRAQIGQSLRLAELAGDDTGRAAAMVNLAVLYDLLGDPLPCIENAQRAAALHAKLSPGGYLLAAMHAEARCREQLGESEKARALVARALEMARSWKNVEQEAFLIAEVAQKHLLEGEWVAAEEWARRSIALTKKTGAFAESHYLLLAMALTGQKRHAEVLEVTRAYREQPNAGGLVPEVAARTFEAKARRGLGHTAAALADLDAAITASETLRAQLAGDASQRASAFSRFEIANYAYIEAVDLYVELGRVEEALMMAERAKGRILLETLRHGRAHRQVRQEQRALGVASLEEMAAALPAGGAFVAFTVGYERTHVFVIRRDAAGKAVVHARIIPIAKRALEETVAAYCDLLAERRLGHRRAGRELDALLLEPIDDLLASVRTIGIAPDRVLWQLPFETLVDRAGRYRVQRHTMFYAPSINVLLEMQNAPRRNSPARTILAVGDPDLGPAARARLSAVYRSADLSPLPAAREEVETIRTIYGRRDASAYVGAAATEARVRAEMGRYRVLHLATHGILDDVTPMYSRLVLAAESGATGTDADGLLEAWELMALDLNADLMVLSSCDSARGRISGGEGLIGLTWAAFVAGARTTVASLWKVASKSTSTIMVDFHRELRAAPAGPAAKAEALRRAKLRMLRDAKYSHPFYWAPFVVIGDPGATR